MLQVAANGSREPAEHPALPLTPEQLAADAIRVRAAGADALHVHPRDAAGRESLRAGVVGPAVAAIRAAVPGMPVGVTTGAWIDADPERLIRGWTTLPDYASVNLAEPGAERVMRALAALGVGIEAGLATAADVARLRVGIPLLRVLVEPGGDDPDAARREVAAIEAALAAAGVGAPQLHHGDGAATWPVVAAARARGLATRIGLEDTLTLPDGAVAADNAALVRAVLS